MIKCFRSPVRMHIGAISQHGINLLTSCSRVKIISAQIVINIIDVMGRLGGFRLRLC